MTPAAISLLALAGCCLKLQQLKLVIKRHQLLTLPLLIIIGSIVSHIFTVNHLGLEATAGALIWITLPLFAFLYYRQIIDILPLFMGLLWVMNCWQLIAEQIWQWNSRMMGVTGNNNWSAALMIISTTFVLRLVWQLTLKSKSQNCSHRFKIIATPIILLSSIMLYFLYSKGANIALPIAATVTLLIFYGKWHKRSFNIGLVGAIIIMSIGLFILLQSDSFARFAAHDVRLPLWSGAWQLILDNPLNGVSPAAFESSFAPYVPVDYYLRGTLVATRNSHPHSHLLYFAASFGLIATLAWGWLLIRPLITQITTRHSNPTSSGRRIIYVFSLLVLLLHGMVDLTIFSWPCSYIFLLILGLLWRDCWPIESKKQPVNKLMVIIGASLGSILLVGAFYISWLNAGSSYFNRQALILIKNHQPKLALQNCNRSLNYKITPQALYRAAMIAIFDLKKPELALHYLKQFDQTPYKNYLSNNGLRARALVVLRRPKQALPYFQQETKNYPIGSLNWNFFYYTLRMLNLSEAATIAKDNLLYSLKVKGMTLDDIPLLLKHSELDIQFMESDGKTPKIESLRK
jgi:O-antigen ligase